MRFFQLVPFAAVAALLPACGDTENGDFSSGVPLKSLPAEYAQALCAAYSACAGELLELFRPGEDCVTNTSIRIEEEFAGIEEAVAAGRATYHGGKARACLDELAARDCAGLLERESAACQAALDGTLAEGEACALDEECEGDAYCSFQDSCPGTCSRREAAGAQCQDDGDCVSGLVCFSATKRCVAPAAAGEPCQQGEPDCSPGYVCLGDDAAARSPGSCIAIDQAFSAKLGEPCDPKAQLCESGSACEVKAVLPGPPLTLTTECAPLAAAGGACRLAFPSECPGDEYCETPVLSLDGTCTPKPSAGEPCGRAGFDAAETPSICAPNTRCDAGVCRELARLGETCSASATCYSDHCVAEACVAGNGCEE